MGSIIALDVGEKRVGVARADSVARLAEPLSTLIRDETFWQSLEKVLATELATMVVVGLPRSLSGDETRQTEATREFIRELKNRITTPIVLQDEALTSKKAEQELNSRGRKFTKADVDALAATYVLEDYLHDTY